MYCTGILSVLRRNPTICPMYVLWTVASAHKCEAPALWFDRLCVWTLGACLRSVSVRVWCPGDVSTFEYKAILILAQSSPTPTSGMRPRGTTHRPPAPLAQFAGDSSSGVLPPITAYIIIMRACLRRHALAALAVTPLLPQEQALLPFFRSVAHAATATPASLEFSKTASGLQLADVILGSGKGVEPDSRVTIHIVGRLVGRQGWVFENSQKEDDEPYRLQCGQHQMIAGLEEGLQGMKEGGVRRLLIPSSLGYTDRVLEPIPRDFGQRQRLYTTVLNGNRRQQESVALGADLTGVVLLDVRLITVRPPAGK